MVSGSLIVFAAQFVLSLFLGRAFCGWVCPAGGTQELALLVRRKAVDSRRIGWIKWLIWAPWVLALVFLSAR